MSAGECLARPSGRESRNPQFSVGSGASARVRPCESGRAVLESFKPEGSDSSDSAKGCQLELGGFYFGALLRFRVQHGWFAKNNTPSHVLEISEASLKGQISFAYPYTSGTAYTLLATMVQLLGEEKGMDYMKRLDANAHHYNTSGSACVTQAGLGEIAVGIAFSHDVMAKGTAKGYPVKLTLPSEGTGYEIGAMAVVKGGPEPDLAKQFITWALSTECQDLMQEWFRIPLNPRAKVAPGAVGPDQVKLIPYDDVWAGQNQARLIDKWREMTNK